MADPGQTQVAAAPEPEPDSTAGVVLTRLAELPERALLDEAALADALSVSDRTVRRMVARGELPPPVQLASRATWQAGRVLGWIEEQIERAEQQARRDARRRDPGIELNDAGDEQDF